MELNHFYPTLHQYPVHKWKRFQDKRPGLYFSATLNLEDPEMRRKFSQAHDRWLPSTDNVKPMYLKIATRLRYLTNSNERVNTLLLKIWTSR